MNNLIKINTTLRYKKGDFKSGLLPITDLDKFKTIVSNENEEIKLTLENYCNKYKIFIIDMDSLELVMGIYNDSSVYLNSEYFTSRNDYEYIDLSSNAMYMDCEPVCVYKPNNTKIYTKSKTEKRYIINWDFFHYGELEKPKLLIF